MSDRTGVGVDWASGAWVVVRLAVSTDPDSADADPEATVVESIEEVPGIAEADTTVVADVPIGLCSGCAETDTACECEHDSDGECFRAVDRAARRLVSPRYSSVFTPPCRAVVQEYSPDETGEDGYQAANERNEELTGKGLMQQAYYITDGIAQVDEFLRDPANDGEIVEGHPEVAFRTLRSTPLAHSKTTAAGVSERVEALRACSEYDPGDLLDAASALRADLEDAPETEALVAGVDFDDLLDAYVLALTAVAPADARKALPRDWPTGVEDIPEAPPVTTDEIPTEDTPEDEVGLPMQMVYRTA